MRLLQKHCHFRRHMRFTSLTRSGVYIRKLHFDQVILIGLLLYTTLVHHFDPANAVTKKPKWDKPRIKKKADMKYFWRIILNKSHILQNHSYSSCYLKNARIFLKTAQKTYFLQNNASGICITHNFFGGLKLLYELTKNVRL